MNRRILTALALSFLTVWAFQYFTRRDMPPGQAGKVEEGKVRAGQFYSAPVQQCWHREPRREVDFIDTKVTAEQEKLITIQTPLCSIKFSNFGGVIQALSFKNHKSKSGNPLETILNDSFMIC